MRKELEIFAESLLWSAITEHVEDVAQLPVMLETITYIDDLQHVISTIKRCEVSDSPSFLIRRYTSVADKAVFDFEMPCTLMAWDDRNALLRITTMVRGQCQALHRDIAEHNWQDMNNHRLLMHCGLVTINRLEYLTTECDNLQA